MIVSYIDSIVGTVPNGYEPLRYMIAGTVLIFLLALGYRFLTAIFGGYKK